MLYLFRTNRIIYSFFLLVYAIVLRTSFLLRPHSSGIENNGFLSETIKNWLEGHHLVVGGVTILIVFLHAIMINQLTKKHRIFRETTLFPGLFYILLVSAIQDFLPLSSILLGNTFLILAVANVLKIYKNPECADAIFNIGFWIGSAALFYNAFFLFLLLALMSLVMLRSFKGREVLMVLCGYALPFLFVSTYFFWNDELSLYWKNYFFNQFNFLDFRFGEGWNTYYKIILLGILFLLGIFNNYKFDKSIKVRNYLNILYLTLLISGITFFVQDNIQINHFLIIAIPLSILLTARFLSMSKTAAEFVHLFLFLGIMLFQFNVFSF